jgi:hypothetical protein
MITFTGFQHSPKIRTDRCFRCDEKSESLNGGAPTPQHKCEVGCHFRVSLQQLHYQRGDLWLFLHSPPTGEDLTVRHGQFFIHGSHKENTSDAFGRGAQAMKITSR